MFVLWITTAAFLFVSHINAAAQFPISTPFRLIATSINGRDDRANINSSINAGDSYFYVGPAVKGGPCKQSGKTCQVATGSSNQTGFTIGLDSSVKLYTRDNAIDPQMVYATLSGRITYTYAEDHGLARGLRNNTKPFPQIIPLGIQGNVSDLKAQVGDATYLDPEVRNDRASVEFKYYACPIRFDDSKTNFYVLVATWSAKMEPTPICIPISLSWVPFLGGPTGNFY